VPQAKKLAFELRFSFLHLTFMLFLQLGSSH
jgi:hypothetical protein